MALEIAGNSRRCFASGRALAPGEFCMSVLVDTVAGLERRDYSLEHWFGPPMDAVGFWRGRIPEEKAPPPRPQPLALDALQQLFETLRQAGEEGQQRLLYVVALLLVRRRALKLQDLERSPEGEFLVVRVPATGETIRIPDPGMSESDVAQVEAELANHVMALET